MKKFKHKSGLIATKENNHVYFIVDDVENSNDWEEIIEKKPLFVTEDGVEMFEGDRYWFVDYYYAIFTVVIDANWHKENSRNSYKRFSTKEAAKEYIDLHKPKYSLKDVEEALCNHGIELFKYDLIEHLKKLNK